MRLIFLVFMGLAPLYGMGALDAPPQPLPQKARLECYRCRINDIFGPDMSFGERNIKFSRLLQGGFKSYIKPRKDLEMLNPLKTLEDLENLKRNKGYEANKVVENITTLERLQQIKKDEEGEAGKRLKALPAASYSIEMSKRSGYSESYKVRWEKDDANKKLENVKADLEMLNSLKTLEDLEKLKSDKGQEANKVVENIKLFL